MSKGDWYRPVDQKKFQRNYLRIFGRECPECKGQGCSRCDDIGFLEAERKDEQARNS